MESGRWYAFLSGFLCIDVELSHNISFIYYISYQEFTLFWVNEKMKKMK